MAKAANFQDVRRFAANVAAAGGTLPGPLKTLLAANSVLTASTGLPARADAPETAIVDAALDGSLTPERLAELLPAAASAAAVNEYAQRLAVRTESVLLGAWHREIDNGAADLVLDSMRKRFDQHAKEIATARSLFNSESSAEHVLASGEPAVIKAWQELGGHITAVAKIAVVAREFGCKPTAQFPQVVPYNLAEDFRVDDTALMVADGGLVADSAYFLRPDGPHRASALFRVPLRLHTIESATRRYNDFAASEFDRVHSGPRGGYIGEDGQMHEDPVPQTPFRKKAAAT